MRVWLLETQPWLHCKVTLHRYLYQLNMLENLDTMSLGNGLPVFIWALLIITRLDLGIYTVKRALLSTNIIAPT